MGSLRAFTIKTLLDKNSGTRRWFKTPQGIIFLISLFLLSINIAYIGKIRPFNSDDIYWQQVVKTWTPHNGHTLYLATKDIFVEQVPFFWLMEHIFSPSRKLIILETWVLTVSAFTMFYFSSLYFLRRMRVRPSFIGLLPFVWLASFGYPLVQNYLNTDWRTFEIGLSFATFALAAAVFFKDQDPLKSRKTKIISLVVLGLIGLIVYSDPYYIFFTLGPLALFAIILYLLKKINRTQVGIILGGTFLSLVFGKIIGLLAKKSGVVIVGDTPSVFVNFDNILTNIVSSIHGLLIVFQADFFGRPAFGLSTFGPMINFAILLFIIYMIWDLRKAMKKPNVDKMSLPQLWPAFFAGVIVFVFVLYTLTTLVAVNNYRFFIILIYCAITILAIVLSLTKSSAIKIVLATLLIGATIYNTSITFLTNDVKARGDVAGNASNTFNFMFIDALKKRGVTKGYAGYWQANINTYLSKGEVTSLPSLCDGNGQTVKFKWLIDGEQFNKPAKKSFYLIDPYFPAPGVCTEDQLMYQFGEPEETLRIADKTLLIFNYDISSKINLSLPDY
jgi:hypothetical protein